MSYPLAHKIIPRRTAYVSANDTNIRATFERIRAEQERTKQLVSVWHTVRRIK